MTYYVCFYRVQMNHKGFTLIELSIVLIIISLVVGGIVGGKSLIKSAELNSLISELKEYETAFNSFELQYDALPGDFNEASLYWPTYVVPVGGSVDGDGDGLIESRTTEDNLSSYHLHLSDLIQPVYESTGIYISSKYGNNTVIKINTSIVINNVGIAGADISSVNGKIILNINYLDATTSVGYKGIISGSDLKSVDKKIDDGLPRTGKLVGNGTIIARMPPPPGCIVSSAYNLSDEGNICNLAYVIR